MTTKSKKPLPAPDAPITTPAPSRRPRDPKRTRMIRRISGIADVDPRTVAKALDGGRVLPAIKRAIESALEQIGAKKTP